MRALREYLPRRLRDTDDGLSHVLLGPIPANLEGCVRKSVGICPVAAISVA